MKTKTSLLTSVMVMPIALRSCNRKTAEPKPQADKPLAQTSEVTITELEPNGDLYRALEAFAKSPHQKIANTAVTFEYNNITTIVRN